MIFQVARFGVVLLRLGFVGYLCWGCGVCVCLSIWWTWVSGRTVAATVFFTFWHGF